jgi:class 3 adenylate cyclase/tetratricopeptide (TPR) repeat protein
MRCPQCAQHNASTARFCLACGTPLSHACSACGGDLPDGARFCPQCGHSVGRQASSTTRLGSPRAYTPKHLAEKILISKGALEGERKQVTVLFADLKGSMELLAGRDPEEARKVLDPVLELSMDAVHRYEGTVNQIMGDGIMALFGAPIAHEDHAVRACYAALRMQESVGRYAEELRTTQGIDVQIRVGLNSGDVVVRSIGSDLRMDYTAVGQTTHLSARLEQLARPGTILISAGTLKLVEDYVQVKPLGVIPIKGLTNAVDVFEVIGGGPARRRFEAVAARGLSRFVGRQTELDALARALAQARAGHGQVVAPVGEPGVGKSRLFWEFTRSHHTQGCLVLESGSVSYGKATPYLVVVDLLKAYFQIDERDEARTIREKVTGRLLSLDRTLEPILPAFLALLEVPVDASEWRTLEPPERRHRTLEGLKRLLIRESQVQPLVLVIEDLHWIDSETQAFLDNLVESVPSARICLLVNYRPEYAHQWGGKSFYTQLRIDPLPPESADDLLASLLGHDAGLQSLKRILIERTQGNPFFLEETVRTLVETRALVGQRGAYRFQRPLTAIHVPVTVQAVLAARIDRLPPEEKRLLQCAAVVGNHVPFPILRAIADVSEEALRRSITHLQAAEFLYEANLFPDVEYVFKHALTHQVAYESVLLQRRRELHAKIVDVIHALYPDHLAEQVERLAHHARHGEVWERALHYARRAGAKALARSASFEAVGYFEHALEALSHMPKRDDTKEQAIDLRFALRHALFPLGEQTQLFDRLSEAKALAETLGDQRRLGRAAGYMTSCYWAMGQHEHAVESGKRALAIAAVVGDVALQIDASLQLGYVYHSTGDYTQAIEFLTSTARSLEKTTLPERLLAFFFIFSRSSLVWCLADLGDFAEGVVQAEAGIRAAEAADHLYGLVAGCVSAGLLYLTKGDYPAAIDTLERGLRLCQVANFPVWFPMSASCLGSAYLHSGRVEEAFPLLEQAVERAAATKHLTGRARWLIHLAEAYLHVGRISEAAELGDRALEFAVDHKERGHEAAARRLRGEILTRRDTAALDAAEQSYRDALQLAGDLQMRPLMAHCHYDLGALYYRLGRLIESRSELTVATRMYRSLGMTTWLGRAEAELSAAR